MICSYTEGRVRFRHEALKNSEAMETMLATLQGFKGLTSCTSNPRTGSILIEFKPGAVNEKKLRQAAAAFEKQFGTAAAASASARGMGDGLADFCLPGCLRGKRGELNALGLTFAGTVLSLAIGRSAHVITGGILCLMTAKHVYDRRKQMM